MKNKIKDIISGWSNFIDKSEVTENTAKERASVCAECEHAKKGVLLGFIKDNLKEIEGYYCNDCEKCPLSAKVRTKNDICEKWRKDI